MCLGGNLGSDERRQPREVGGMRRNAGDPPAPPRRHPRTSPTRRVSTHSTASRTRVLGVVAALAVVLLLAMLVKGRIDADRFTELVAAARDDRAKSFSRLLALRSESIDSFVRDYTPWDDMVEFTKEPGETFSRENLEPAIDSFHLSALRVFDRSGTMIFSAEQGSDERNPGDGGAATSDAPASVLPTARTGAESCTGVFPVDAGVIARMVAGNDRFWRFFAASDCGPVEVVGATIHTTADHERRGDWYGTLFATRVWDVAMLAELSHLSGFEVSYRPGAFALRAGDRVDDPADDEVTFRHPLLGENAAPIGVLDVRMPARAVAAFRDTLASSFVVLMAFVGLLLAGLMAVLGREVARPLSLISSALQEDSPAPIHALARRATEFGDVARTLANFFEQRGSLDDERRAREAAEAALGAAREDASTLSRERIEMLDNFAREAQREIVALGQVERRLLDTGLAPAQVHITRTLRDHQEALSRLVSDLAEVSRLDADATSVDSRPFDPLDLLEESLDLVAGRAQTFGVDLCAEGARDLPARLLADASRVQQTLGLLIEHAMRSARGGSLVVRSSLEHARDAEATLSIVLEAAAGARAGNARASTRVADESTDSESATVSLELARRLASRAGGSIAVSHGRGATLLLTLRVPVQRLAAAPTEVAHRHDLRGRRILLIEPAAATRHALASQIAATGARTENVDGLEEAIALLVRARSLDEPFDAVLVTRELWNDGWQRLGEALAPGVEAAAWPIVVLRPLAGEDASRDPRRPTPATLRKPVRRQPLFDRLLAAIDKKPRAPRVAPARSPRAAGLARDSKSRVR